MKCYICGKEFEGFGNNPYPLAAEPESRCCDECNEVVVMPIRLRILQRQNDVAALLEFAKEGTL